MAGDLEPAARKALNDVRDTFATVEVLGALLVQQAGQLPHMRDSAARAINYTHPSVTSAALVEGDAYLAEALACFQKGVAHLKRAHLADLEVIDRAGIKAGRPRTRDLSAFAERILERLDGMDKFGR